LTHGASRPDLALITDDSVYVLDPTLSRSPDLHRDKAKYLDVLSVARARTSAGVRFPTTGTDRSSAAAPLPGTSGRPTDWRGEHGVLPMEPGGVESGAIGAWVGDLLEHS